MCNKSAWGREREVSLVIMLLHSISYENSKIINKEEKKKVLYMFYAQENSYPIIYIGVPFFFLFLFIPDVEVGLSAFLFRSECILYGIIEF